MGTAGLTVALATAVSLPLGHGLILYAAEAEALHLKAQLIASRLSADDGLRANPGLLHETELGDLLAIPDSVLAGTQRRILDGAGTTLHAEGDVPAWPVLSRSAPIVSADLRIGRAEVRVSLRPLLASSSLSGLIGLLLGAAVWVTLRSLPLRALDRILSALHVEKHALRRREDQLDAALTHMSHGLAMFDAGRRLVLCNPAFLDMYGLRPDQALPGTSMRAIVAASVARGNHPGLTVEEIVTEYEARLSSSEPGCAQVRLGNGHSIALSHRPLADGGAVIIFEDVTAARERETRIRGQNEILRQREEELSTRNLQFDTAIENMAQGLCMFDGDGRLVVYNRRYLELFGLPPGVMRRGMTQAEVISYLIENGYYENGVTVESICETTRSLLALDSPRPIDRTLADGRVISVCHRAMAGGGWVATFEDITERRRNEARIAHMAGHDALTGLANRVLFRQRLEDTFREAGLLREAGEGRSGKGPSGPCFAVLCLDLDRFKEVNDTLGHAVGDALLLQVAERLRGLCGQADAPCSGGSPIVARLGGDEFALILPALARPGQAGDCARRIVDALGEPYDLDGHFVVAGASVGIALAPGDGADPDEIMKSADLALYKAKSEGRGTFRHYEPAMNAGLRARRSLELDMRQAFAQGAFVLHYQPVVDLAENRISGFEALLRWPHPERGLVPPSEFIGLAEDIGLIVPLGEWVLRRACEEAASWPGDARVAVNLSAVQFRSRNLVAAVVSALGASGLPASRLELEITESVLLLDSEATLATLHQLRALGVRIAMDDFGTGYSSMSYLRAFPFDKIKIDRSFVRDMAAREDCLAIVRAVLGLASSLGMTTTAEGIETAEQLERLRAEGCTEGQGYLFSPPRPGAEVCPLLAGPGRSGEGAPPVTRAA